MIYPSIFFCVIFAFIVYRIEKTLVNPVTILFSLWAFIIFMSSLELYSLLPASSSIYNVIFLGLLSFLAGYLFIKLFSQNMSNDTKINGLKKEFRLRKRLIYFLCIICILFYLKEFAVVVQYLLGGNSLAYIRAMAQTSDSAIYTNKSGLENALKILIITPFTGALQPIVASNVILGAKDKKLILMNIAIIVLRVLTDGSRTLVVYFGMSMIVAFLLNTTMKKVQEQKKKRIKRYLFFSVVIIFIAYVMYLITSSRSGDNLDRFSYYYFSMQPVMFEKWANIVDNQGIIGYGWASLNGFGFAFFYILNNIFKIGYPSKWQAVYTLIEGTGTFWQSITYMDTQANSFVSAFWVFYLDGRTYGIIIGMFVYGIISTIFFFRAKKQMDERLISIYAFICIGLFYTFVRLQFANIYYDLSLIFILFFSYKSVKIRKDMTLP